MISQRQADIGNCVNEVLNAPCSCSGLGAIGAHFTLFFLFLQSILPNGTSFHYLSA